MAKTLPLEGVIVERCPTCGHGFVKPGELVCVLCEGARKAAERERRRDTFPKPTRH